MTEKLVRVVQSLYDGCHTLSSEAALRNPEPFPLKVGLHQGSALSPFLFAVVMDTIAKPVREGDPSELLYADDIAISAESEILLQEELLKWQEELERKGLKINGRKTEVMLKRRMDRTQLI